MKELFIVSLMICHFIYMYWSIYIFICTS